VDFLTTSLTQPSLGDCRNDTLTISGVDTATQRVVPTFCGNLNGQSSKLFLSCPPHTDAEDILVVVLKPARQVRSLLKESL
jgi:hypothetical protein